MYIDNLSKQFEPFRFAEMKTAFNPVLLEYYIAHQIPGAVVHRQPNTINIIDVIDLCSEHSIESSEHDDDFMSTCSDKKEIVTEKLYKSVCTQTYDYEADKQNSNDKLNIFKVKKRRFSTDIDNVIVID